MEHQSAINDDNIHPPATQSQTEPPQTGKIFRAKIPFTRAGRFDLPPEVRISRLQRELLDLRARFAAQERELEELNEFKENSGQQIEELLNVMRDSARADIEKLESELAVAKQQSEVAIQKAEIEINKLKSKLETVRSELGATKTELETARNNWMQIETTMVAELLESRNAVESLRIELETARAHAATTQVQAAEPTTTACENEHSAEEPATRVKTPSPTSSDRDDFVQESKIALDRHPKRRYSTSSTETVKLKDEPLARLQREETSLQLLPKTDKEDIPLISCAQVPSPTNVVFARSLFLQGPLLRGESRVSINFPAPHGAILPPFGQPDIGFSVWLQEHGATAELQRLNVLTRDLELRRRFLLQERLTQEEQVFVIEHIPHASISSPSYLRALAGLAIHLFDDMHVFPLLFCFTKWRSETLQKFLDNL